MDILLYKSLILHYLVEKVKGQENDKKN